MNQVHIILGKDNATHLVDAFQLAEKEELRVLCIEDDFSYGPLRDPEQPFSLLRHQFWQTLGHTEILDPFHDLERIIELLNQCKEDESVQVVFWMNNKAAELLTYYFLLHYLKTLVGRLFVININGLPFLNDDLQLFYPVSFKDINAKGIIKALKLARPITASEFEADADEWKVYQNEGATLRRIKSGKQIISVELDGYDQSIIDAINTYPQKKWARIYIQLKPVSNKLEQLFFNSRLQSLINQNIIHSDNGNLSVLN